MIETMRLRDTTLDSLLPICGVDFWEFVDPATGCPDLQRAHCWEPAGHDGEHSSRRWFGRAKALDSLLVEVIESHADRVRVMELVAAEHDELRVENERLRAALEKHHWPHVVPGDGPCEQCGLTADVWYGLDSYFEYNPPTTDPHIPDVRNCGCTACRARHVCCGCGGLCDSNTLCPMAYACGCNQPSMSVERGPNYLSPEARAAIDDCDWFD